MSDILFYFFFFFLLYCTNRCDFRVEATPAFPVVETNIFMTKNIMCMITLLEHTLFFATFMLFSIRSRVTRINIFGDSTTFASVRRDKSHAILIGEVL